MSTEFLSTLSQNYIELLDDDELYDTIIEVGEVPDVKMFRAHMNILCYRSLYLRGVLISNKKNNNYNAPHIKLPNISPNVFQIVLKYIYGGILSLEDQDTSDIIKVLLAADELLLHELVDYLQKYLIFNKPKWMEQHFELIHQTGSQSNSLSELQQFCADLMIKSPEKIFKSLDFTSLPEKSLVHLIKRDNLKMKEIEVWEHVLKWGLSKNPTLNPNPNTWSDGDFKTMENTLQHCLPLIRFFSLSSKDFLQKVHPYKKLLKHQLYEDLLNSHLNPDSKPTDHVSIPRNIKIDEVTDSKIVDFSTFLTVLRWIDREMVINTVVNNNFAQIRELNLNLPYKFKLLLRGSQDGFTPKKFHELCDDKHNTITFIKVKGTKEIIGGYNPSEWKSSGEYGKARNSFIFSFKNENNFIKDVIISNVGKTDFIIDYHSANGPRFGYSDIFTCASNQFTDYSAIWCKKHHYKKEIRDSEDQFSMEDYEVFQIIRR